MNYNLYKTTFFFIMIMSIMLMISSNSWINMWLSMEMNMMSFIPLMIKSNNSLTTESSMNYFLVQSFSSMNFMFFILFKMINNFNMIMNKYIIIILNLAILMKLGAAPFYQWFPKTMKGLSWMNCFLLSTLQKIIPMMLLKFLISYNIIMMSIILSSLIGAISGFNQTNLKMLMSYSSINHMGWMMSSLLLNINMWLIYFLMYMYMNFILMMIFKIFNMNNLIQIYLINMPLPLKLMIFINMLSLGGLPPLLGFIPKWFLINNLIFLNMNFITFILIMTSLINLFFYLRISISTFMMNNNMIKYNNSFIINKNYINMLMYSSIFSLIIITLIFQIY